MFPVRILAIASIAMMVFFISGDFVDGQEQTISKKEITDVVVGAFAETHDGFSSDEVLLQDKLNQAFVAACKSKLPEIDESKLNWTLLNLRKAGKLKGVKTTKRTKADTSNVTYISEIVARSLQDKHGVSSDKIMADP